MRSQLEFFMTEADEREFVSAFTAQADTVHRESPGRWFFRVGAVGVEFSPSPRSKDQLALGRIAIATHFGEKIVPEADRAERLYKRMRSWLRKRYSNRLMVTNLLIPNSAAARRSMWLGPDARQQVRSGTVALWAIPGGRITVHEEPNQSPEPTPASVTPRAGARVAPVAVVAHL